MMTLPALSLLWSLSFGALIGPDRLLVGDSYHTQALSTPHTTETVVLGARAVFPSGTEILLLSTLETRSDPGNFPFFYPRSQTYALELRALPFSSLAISLRHSCTHPVLSFPLESSPTIMSTSTYLTVSIGSPSLLRGPQP